MLTQANDWTEASVAARTPAGLEVCTQGCKMTDRSHPHQAGNRPVRQRWHDAVWLQQRQREAIAAAPVSIYRLDPSAWRRDAHGLPYAWKALAEPLVPYVADLGFTHVELMHVDADVLDPVFAAFVDACHEGGIGVILEWHVGGEGQDEIDRALAWIEGFHLDGLHLMAGNDATEALNALALGIAARYPDVLVLTDSVPPAPSSSQMLVCSAAWPRATQAYLSELPENRSGCHGILTDSLAQAFDVQALLPMADADSTTGRHAWFERMPSDTWQRFANLRAWLGFMWAHPGKKLLGMGAEFAQLKGWRETGSLDWTQLDDANHAGMLRLVADLNRQYVNEPALHCRDSERGSFAWVVGDDTANSVVAFLRYGAEGTAPLLVIVNFTPRVHHGYRLGAPALGTWHEILNTDSICYGGSNVGNANNAKAELIPSHGYPASIALTLPPLAALFLRQGDWPA